MKTFFPPGAITVPSRATAFCRRAFPLLALLMFSGCSNLPQFDQGKSKQLTHHNWWNYYQRGMVYFEEKNYKAASEDFERALGLRPGARFGSPQEMWRARTYGLHFLEGYFPHRELGISLYLLGDTAKATPFLEESLRQLPSGRAKHYINLANAKQFRGAQIAVPRIRVDGLKRDMYIKDKSAQVAGVASGKGLIRDLLINNKPEFVELASEEMSFDRSVPLTEGSNLISIVAHDLAGNRAKADLIVFADWRPPDVAVKKVQKVQNGWQLSFVCSDDNALTSVKVKGVEKILTPRATWPGSVSVDIPVDGGHPTRVTAQDIAGNKLETVFTQDDLKQMASASTAPVEETLPDAGAGQAKNRKPSLRLLSQPGGGFVLREEFYLDGIMTDAGGVSSLTLNGRNMLKETDKGALQVRFALRVPLENGTNRFTIAGSGVAGDSVEKKLQVVRKEPDYLDNEYRLRFEVPPPLRCDHAEMKRTLTRQMETEMTREPARFHLLERDDGAMAMILRELELSVSDLADKKAALQIGKILPAELVLFCSLLRNGKGLTLFARIVDAESGEIIWTGDVYAESERDLVEKQVGGLVMKTEQQFPLLEGRIVDASGSMVAINSGADKGIRLGTRFLLVQQAEKGAGDTKGFIVKIDGKPVEVEVVRMKNGLAMGRLEPSQATMRVKEGDYVYAR